MTKNIQLAGVVLILLILAAGCGQVTPSGQNPATARAMTLYAVLTESAHNLNNPSPTLSAATNTAVSGIPTSTPTPAATATSAVTILPSVTPTSSKLATPCYRAFFVKDVTIPDYTAMNPGETFVKTWRLRNNGSCDWAADTSIGFFSGTQMGGPSSQSLGQIVAVGDQIDISLTLKAPTDPGTYTGYWMLLTPSGGRFGLGDAGDQSFWVLITVRSGTTTPSVTNTLGTPTNTGIPTATRTPTATPSLTPLPTYTQTQTQNAATQTYCTHYPTADGC
jgi:hypothetical protein